MEEPEEQDRLGLGAVGQLLGVPRLTVWWWYKNGPFRPTGVQDGQPWWSEKDVYTWALWQQRKVLAGRVPLTAWPTARGPAHYVGARELDGAVAQRWAVDVGTVVVVWPLTRGHDPGNAHWARQVPGSGHRAVVIVTGGVSLGPELEGVLPGLPGRTYQPWWAELARVLGRPAPYWPSTLREARLLRDWEPNANPVAAMAVPALDTATLLRTASTYDEGHPASRVLVNLAQVAQTQATNAALRDLTNLTGSFGPEENDAVLTVAARPFATPDVELEDVDEVQRRAGWQDLLARSDVDAIRCVREHVKWDGGADQPYGNPAHIEPHSSRWAREWSKRLIPAQRTAATARLSSEHQAQPLTDPATDSPVAREPDGGLRVAVPQRLPARAPLAEIILEGPIWVRTADGTLYPAPRDSYFGLGWGYRGSGPGTLALLIAALLDDITAKAPAGINGAPAGLEALTGRKLPEGTVLTRKQLEAARRGDPPILAVDDQDDDEDEE